MPIEGSIGVVVSVQGGNPAVHLNGGGTGWNTTGGNLTLTPGNEPAHYKFTFALASPSPASSLVGIRLFMSSSDNAKIGIPASSSGEVKVELLDSIPHGSASVTYHMSIGVQIEIDIHWLDPTISFDPQPEPPPV